MNPHGLWSRPLPFSLNGVRPNSPPQTTNVSSSSPRAFRSVSNPAIGLSEAPHIFVWLPSMSVCASQPLPLPQYSFYEPHPALDQPPREQAVRTELGRDRSSSIP